jgi:hypothetical protein
LKIGTIVCTETLVTTNLSCVTCQKNKISKMHIKLKSGTLGARGCFVGLGIDGMIILKGILKT